MASTLAVEPVVEPRRWCGQTPFYYGWVNVVLAAVTMTATLPGRTHGLGLITEPLLADLDLDAVRYGVLNFWSILLGAVFTLAIALFGLIWSAITLFNQSLLADRGFDTETFYLIMALLTGSGLLFNLLGGWLATRWPLGRLLALGLVLLAGGLAAFPAVRTLPHAVAYALVLGAAGGFITVVHFACYAQAFGRTHLGQIQGAAQVLTVCASAMGPLLLAWCHEQTGSSAALFRGVALAAVLLAGAAWWVPWPCREASLPGKD